MRSGHRLTIKEMVDELILSFNATRLILTEDLNMRRMNMRCTSKLLQNEQTTLASSVPTIAKLEQK